MSRYIDRALLSDEAVIYSTQLHWVIYLQGIFVLLAGAVVGNFAFGNSPLSSNATASSILVYPLRFAALALVFYGAIALLVAYVKQGSTELVITNRRVIAKYGFVAVTSFEVMLERVEGANIDQTVMGRILGYGTIFVRGTGGGISPVDNVAEPNRFQKALLNTISNIPGTPSSRRADELAPRDAPFLLPGAER